jgi:hypothetical protein
MNRTYDEAANKHEKPMEDKARKKEGGEFIRDLMRYDLPHADAK